MDEQKGTRSIHEAVEDRARKEKEKRLSQEITTQAIEDRFPDATVYYSPTNKSWRVKHLGGQTVDYMVDTSGQLQRGVKIAPEKYAESFVADHGGEQVDLPDGRTVTVPETVEELVNHPDYETLVNDIFRPAGAYSKSRRRVLISPDHLNMETFEEESFHAAFSQALSGSERQQLIDDFGSEEGAYHKGLNPDFPYDLCFLCSVPRVRAIE